MGEIILETEIKREPGFLFYCGTNKKGNIVIGKSKMARGNKKKASTSKPKVAKKAVAKKVVAKKKR